MPPVFWISGTRLSYEAPIDRWVQDELVVLFVFDVTRGAGPAMLREHT